MTVVLVWRMVDMTVDGSAHQWAWKMVEWLAAQIAEWLAAQMAAMMLFTGLLVVMTCGWMI